MNDALKRLLDGLRSPESAAAVPLPTVGRDLTPLRAQVWSTVLAILTGLALPQQLLHQTPPRFARSALQRRLMQLSQPGIFNGFTTLPARCRDCNPSGSLFFFSRTFLPQLLPRSLCSGAAQQGVPRQARQTLTPVGACDSRPGPRANGHPRGARAKPARVRQH